MKPSTRRRALLASAGLVTGSRISADPIAWKVFGSLNYEPLLFPVNGRASGLLVERLRATEAKTGARFDIELTDWQRALALAKAGAGGLIGASFTEERATWLDYSAPIYHDDLHLVVKASSRLKFRQLSDLRGLRIGMTRGTTGGAAFDEALARGEFQVLRDWNSAERLRALLAGRLDAAVIGNGRLGIERALGRAPDLKARLGEVRQLQPPLLRDALHLAFPKTMKAGALLQRFNAALTALPQPK